MPNAPLLTIAYLERLPKSSAKAIAGMEPQDAAALFETIPTRVVTPIIEKMEKWPAAQCLQHLSPEQTAAILGDVSYQDAIVLLRLTPVERRNAVLDQLPSRLARDLRLSLRYPRNCVGAWMDLSVPMLSFDASVKDALDILRATQRPVDGSIFVVDERQQLAGIVRVEALLRHSASVRLADIVQTGVRPLLARMLLREAQSVASWDDFVRLPVAGRRGQLIGTLSRGDMNKGLAAITPASVPSESDNSVWTQIGGAFIVSMAGLVSVLGMDASEAQKETWHGG